MVIDAWPLIFTIYAVAPEPPDASESERLVALSKRYQRRSAL